MIKYTLTIAILLLLCPLGIHAQDKSARSSMAQYFKAMPDSVLPYLSENNRLDMIDFKEAGMKALVTNLLDGNTEMTALTADSLSITMNNVLRIDITLDEAEDSIDGSKVLLRLKKTYTINERQAESITDVYSSAWRFLSRESEPSSLLFRDEKLLPK